MPGYLHQPDAPLLAFSSRDAWTVEDSFSGVQVFGMTGSGKTSGSAQAIARALLQAGYGFLVCCAKPGEAELWRRYAHECGRASELLVIGEDSEHSFNFLNYELCQGEGLQAISNTVALFMKIMEAGRLNKEMPAAGERFWDDALG
ncbi:MAG: hypothetical protein KDJ52_33130, partial [Anaerolineae bacterium]|nr:hypothetical protein [Anaerolineae bacterium]